MATRSSAGTFNQ